MEEIQFTLCSAEQTDLFGVALGHIVVAGDVICLDGDLGAGKTTMTQSIAKGVGVDENCYVTSPSFAIFHEYPGKLPIYHMDFYRLHDYTEVEDIGLEEYFYLRGVTVIEWALRAEEILPSERLHLFLEIAEDGSRRVTCKFSADVWRRRLAALLRKIGSKK